ncbi:protein FAR1-RELATED SEQUENCE 5-like [Chenopodium quinoa]|uniref:protein FAR1-RELATED SEQUENCE 5-like n=1 Tax=Chenopodium quinoa TaxID=63459 RepID=UPI000B798D4A|nr:protein FAR1-RELATED SEQUENCE 5-like [Chenopodium quinoa]
MDSNVPKELKPSLGMIFKDPEEGLSFYKAYANAAGFTSRKSTTKRKKNNKDIIAFQYGVCNKEGFRAIRKPIAQQTVYEEGKVHITRKRLVTRVGCNAHICMRYDAGKYVVTHFKEEHNHLLYTPSCAKFQKDNRKMHIMHKKLIVDNSKVNVGPVRSYTMMKELAGSHDNVGASKQDFKNFYRDLKAYIDGSDAQMFVDNFQNKKVLWSAFFFSYDVDEEDRLCRALWADPICRKNYALFGDMVSFDTTFKTNRYNMIFGPFTGVDHHKKCVTFADSFVAHEDISSFEWVFKTFLKAMGNNEPIEPAEFEEKWNKVISEFHLNDHEWLAYMYNIRDMWIPAYFRDLFLGGIMRTTSRSESENNFFTMFTNPHLTLIEFYMRFECALNAQRHTQNKMDNDSKNKRPECKTPIPLEKDASELFTTTIFYEFQYELEIGCFNCGVEEMKKDNELYIFNLREGTRRRTFDVVFDPTTFDTKCFCKKFERDGVPCRHMIWVWKARMLEKIPKAYILNRWCTMAYKKPIFDLEGNVLEECINAVDKKMLLNDLWSEIHACVSLVQNNEYDLSDLVKKLRAMRVDLEQKKTNGSNNLSSKVKDIEMLIGASSCSKSGKCSK